MPRLVLWDVDGTLIKAGDVGAQIFDRAVARTVGGVPRDRVSMGGKTDPQIVREYLELMGLDDIDNRVSVILGHLEQELAAAVAVLAAEGCALPGVKELLPRLAGTPGLHQSVLTGNIAPNAIVKLGAFELAQWLDLDVGAYGSDNADRTQLVPVALERLRRRRGIVVEPDEVWVVGDTANDLACARAGGARCLLVATGRVSLDDLVRLGPDAVMADLSDVDAVASLLSG